MTQDLEKMPVSVDVEHLECPRCEPGFGNLHHGAVHVFVRNLEDGPGHRIDVPRVSAVPSVTPLAANEIPGRRDGLEIDFYCENCGDALTLVVLQHKGSTYVHWLIGPERETGEEPEELGCP